MDRDVLLVLHTVLIIMFHDLNDDITIMKFNDDITNNDKIMGEKINMRAVEQKHECHNNGLTVGLGI